MLPKKLFSPKCLHPDRDIVFQDDLTRFFNIILTDYNIISNEDELIKIPNFTYKKYKHYYNQKHFSMIHFSISKEENQKEYYEVLFGEIQFILFNKYPITSPISSSSNNTTLSYFHKIFSIYTLYSLYYTQIHKEFYQINTIPEYLNEVNMLINTLAQSLSTKEIAFTLYQMVLKLKKDQAFSIGTLIGLKTIILNKYGLPLEQKTNVYKDYLDLFNYNKNLNCNNDNYELLLYQYNESKKNVIDLIKHSDINKDEYVNFVNNEIVDKIDQSLNLDGNELNKKITVNDLETGKVTTFDCLFNKMI